MTPIRGLKPEFEETSMKRFRENYKSAGKDYVVSEKIENQPTKVASLPKLAKPTGEWRFQAFHAVLIRTFFKPTTIVAHQMKMKPKPR